MDMGFLEITDEERQSPAYLVLAVCYLQVGGWDVPKI